MAKKLPMAIQIRHARNLFCAENPPCDAISAIDFGYVMDKSLSYGENLEALSEEYPMYRWAKTEEEPARLYEREIVSEAKDLVDDFSYSVIKKYKLEDLERDSRRAERLSKKLKTYRKPSLPGVCPVKKVKVREHFRCKPRR